MEEKQKFPSYAGSGKVLTASLFILSGLLLFARNMGIITEAWFNMLVAWHSLFIIAGIYTMIRKHYLSGGVLLLAGLYLLGSKLMLFPGNFQAMLWPLALILIGIFFLRHHHRRNWTHQRTVHRRAKMVQRMMNKRMGEQEEQQCQSDDGFLYSNNSLSAVRHVVLDELFKGANIRTYFGGTTIDLRHTNIAPGETYIDLDCSWGRVELYIPADWQVRIECSCFCGGCEDKRWQGTPAKQEWCVLMIRGNISFGGLEIKD